VQAFEISGGFVSKFVRFLERVRRRVQISAFSRAHHPTGSMLKILRFFMSANTEDAELDAALRQRLRGDERK
jgi:hypothetical protein